LALPERAALGSRSRHGAHGIARRPAQPLSTQNAWKLHREAKPGRKAVAQKNILIFLDEAFLQNEAKHFFSSQGEFGSQLAEAFGSTELNVAYRPTSAIA
jgi:hypothetical protein